MPQPNLEGIVPDFVRQQSGSLLRATSSTFTGGAVPLPSQDEESATPSETTPLRQPSRRNAETRDQLAARLRDELMQFLWRSRVWIVIVGILFFATLMALIVFFVAALVAVITTGDKPCDRPLQFYLLAVFLWLQISSRIIKPCLNFQLDLNSSTGKLVLTVVMWIPSWGIIGWGIYMIASSRTCPKTNPHLFFPTERFIIAQVVFTLLYILVLVLVAYNRRFLLVLLSRLDNGPGCEKAVHQLPKVAPDAKELLDEDGQTVMDCPICTDSLAEQSQSAVVRTSCKHYFHEECLATWCKNHTDCPLCREKVGEEDDPVEVV
jgi:hypothetical protein